MRFKKITYHKKKPKLNGDAPLEPCPPTPNGGASVRAGRKGCGVEKVSIIQKST